ncbi:MAG: type II toxin-antitoxin system RelE/ParE family toxin [Proteobacteria bacterium]|nr:type II toxin-antitoxin system RelE/ParE family toxin [Pseudomonadota bacterium]
MIKTFAHKGLEKFFATGSKAGIRPDHAGKLGRQLAILNVARDPQGMDYPGWKLHPLTGDMAGHWAVWVSGNWRLTFRFIGEDAEIVDYQDYH